MSATGLDSVEVGMTTVSGEPVSATWIRYCPTRGDVADFAGGFAEQLAQVAAAGIPQPGHRFFSIWCSDRWCAERVQSRARSYDGLERVALVGCGGISHSIGNPRVCDIDEEFDHWFLNRLERGEVEQVLDIRDDEIELAGNGNHEMSTWVAVAGAMGGGRGRS